MAIFCIFLHAISVSRQPMRVNMTKTRKALRLIIHGRVQGVFFRDSMRNEAQRIGVTGWVQNNNDGTVEAVVHGDPASVEDIVRWTRLGPQQAQVERIEIEPDEGSYSSFEIIR